MSAPSEKKPETDQVGGGDIELDKPTVVVGDVVGGDVVEGNQELQTQPTYHDVTARRLAVGFMWIFAIGSLVHYLSTLYIASQSASVDSVKALAEVYNLWLPVVASFVSATAGYYFAKSKG
jgi:hypothetical protein